MSVIIKKQEVVLVTLLARHGRGLNVVVNDIKGSKGRGKDRWNGSLACLPSWQEEHKPERGSLVQVTRL